MNAHDILMYGNLWVLKHLEGLGDADLEHPDVCGYWSTRDIMAHLASYEWVLVDVLCGLVEPCPTPSLDKLKELHGDAFNAFQVKQRKGKTPDEVISEYKNGYERVMELLSQVDPQVLHQPGRLPWYGEEYSLDDFIVYQYYGHKREHMAQVAVFRDSLRK